MPIFEYECRDCGTRFERIEPAASENGHCEYCSSTRVERLLSVFAVSAPSAGRAVSEPGPCPCGAPRRGMCGE